MEEITAYEIIGNQVITMFNFSFIQVAKLFLVVLAVRESWDFIKKI